MNNQNIDIDALSAKLSQTVNSDQFKAMNLDPQTQEWVNNVSNLTDQLKNSDLLTCDMECQREKQERNLYNEYVRLLDAAEKVPRELEDAERNYYVFAKGTKFYQNMEEEKYKKYIDEQVNTYSKKGEDSFNKINTLLSYLTNQVGLKDNYNTISGNYTTVINKIEDALSDASSNLNIENRNVYYDSQKIENYSVLNNVLFYVYYFMIAVLAVVLLAVKRLYKNKQVLSIIGLLAVFPYAMNFLYSIGVTVVNGVKRFYSYL